MKGITKSGFRRLSLSYPGNLGFAEMMQFYTIATPEQVELMEYLLKHEDWNKAWNLLKDVTGVDLEDLPKEV